MMTDRSEKGMKMCYPTPSEEPAKAVLPDDAFSSGLKLAWVRPEEMIVASLARTEHA
jgi:hypothetical protein